MQEKFQNTYRIGSTRLQSWDYASEGMYFVTICTKNREHYFGTIENGKMNLSELGQIVENEWLKTPEIRPDMNLELGAFVVMPNHFHAILIIGKNEFNTTRRTTMHCDSTGYNTDSKNQFAPQSKNLASVTRGFKSSVTTYARKNKILFDWQRLYHDHIIRSTNDFFRISKYIENNPKNWSDDSLFKNNLLK